MLFTWWKKRNKTTSDSEATEAVPAMPDRASPQEPEAVQAGPVVRELPREKIAARAYEIWVMNGRPSGTGLRDWLQAEAELRAEFAQQAPERLPTQPR